jgi:probable FeS assembly SUF system protein SufT
MSSELKILTRDVEASVVPVGTKVTLQKGEQAHITQSLGGTFTVIVNGNMFRIESRDADALGIEISVAPPTPTLSGPLTQEELEKKVWESLKTCYDPEIPVNIVDLGLVYDCSVEQPEGAPADVRVKMTLTAPGCGMGPVIAREAEQKIMALPGVASAEVEVVWDPAWNQSMISEVGKMKLGLI